MKHVKMLALVAVAAGALMAFIGAGTASATVLCSTTTGNNPCPTAQKWFNVPFDFSIASGGSSTQVSTAGESVDKCTTSTIKGKITNTGSATETVTGPVEELTWGGCTFPTKTLKTANLEVHRIAGTSSGTVTTDGTFEWTVNTVLFGSCIFKIGSGVSLGDLIEGNPAVLVVNAVANVTGVPCPTTVKWTGTYTLTEPKSTTLSVSDSTD